MTARGHRPFTRRDDTDRTEPLRPTTRGDRRRTTMEEVLALVLAHAAFLVVEMLFRHVRDVVRPAVPAPVAA
jgi:hypothetical protein